MSYIKDLLMGVMHCRGGDETGGKYVSGCKSNAPKASGPCGVQRVESTDAKNLVVLRDLASGTYLLHGWFTPYANSGVSISFSSDMLVSVLHRTNDTQVQVFYPLNNAIQHLKITDTDYVRTNVYLNDLQAAVSSLTT